MNRMNKANQRNQFARFSCGRLLKKAASEAAGERKPEAYPLGYVEDFVEPRTKMGAFFSSLLKYFPILPGMHTRLVGKTEGGAVGIACVVQIDAIMPADGFHGCFKWNSLRVEVSRRMRAAG